MRFNDFEIIYVKPLNESVERLWFIYCNYGHDKVN